MRVLLEVASYYDWEPYPAGAEPSQAEVTGRRAKPTATGGWLKRVLVKSPSQTDVMISEAQIIEAIIRPAIKRGVALTRSQALASYLEEVSLPHQTSPKHIRAINVHDDGPSRELFEDYIGKHIDCGNIDPELRDELVTAYMQEPDHFAGVREDHAKSIAPAIADKSIREEDVHQLVRAKLVPHREKLHVEHLSKHFGVKTEAAK